MFLIALLSVLITIAGMAFIIINGLLALTILGVIIGYVLAKRLRQRLSLPAAATGPKPKYAINRKTFFFFAPVLPWIILSILGLCFPASLLATLFSIPYGMYYLLFLCLCVYLICYIPAARCRSLDCGMPWLWVILSLIPFVGLWFWGELLLRNSIWKKA